MSATHRGSLSGSGSVSARSSLSGLPPLGSASASAALAGASAGVSSTATAAAAAAYKAHPSDLTNSLSKAVPVDRAAISEQRRKLMRLGLAATHTGGGATPGGGGGAPSSNAAYSPAPPASGGIGSSKDSVSEFAAFSSGMTSLTFGNSTGSGAFGAAAPMRIPTPLPVVMPAASADDALGIDLHLPSTSSSRPSGSMSAPNSARQPPSSSLASLTQDGNARLAQFLDQYDSSASAGGATGKGDNTSMRLLLYGLVRLSARELEEEKEVSRKLLSWHPARSAKQVALVQHKIKAIIAERNAALDGSRAGKPLVEDERAREELPKRASCLFKLHLPAHVSILKLDLEVSEGRLEMYVAAGEVVNQLNYARQKQRCWSLRAGVGHATLTVSSNDTNFRADEDYFIAFYALTQTSFIVKPTFGGKNKGGGGTTMAMPLQSSAAAATAAAATASANVTMNPNVASSSNPLNAASADALPDSLNGPATSRQQGGIAATNGNNPGVQSVRNLRKALDARIKALQDNPKARAEFQARVARMRRHGVAPLPGADRPNSIHPPSHLTLTQLQKLNEQEAAIEATQLAAEQARAAQYAAAASPAQRAGRSIQRSAMPAVTEAPPSPRRELSPSGDDDSGSVRSVPLSPSSLDVIAHIAAIPGVSRLFFETAVSIRLPTPLLDERGCIVIEGQQQQPSASVAIDESKMSPPRSRERGDSRREGGSDSGSVPSSPRAARQRQQQQQDSSSLEQRDYLVANSLESFMQRVFKKLRLQAAQLLLLGQKKHPSQTAGGASAGGKRGSSNGLSAGPEHGSSTSPVRHSSSSPPRHVVSSSFSSTAAGYTDEELENAREESKFLSRCLNIFQMHAQEIEAILIAHVSGDRSLPHVARLLPPPPGAPRSAGEKNFLLVNAFQATDNRAYAPRMAEKRRRQWISAHDQRMSHAEVEHARLLAEKRDQTLAAIERKEVTRLAALAQKQAEEEQRQLEERQKLWLRYIAAALRHSWLRTARLNLQPMRIESFRKATAAKKIQRFVRTALLLRRRTRASLHFQAFRSLMLAAAFNYGAVKRDRAATCIKVFLSQKRGVDSVSRLIKNFRRRVGICQRRTKAWREAKHAKIALWRVQCVKACALVADPSIAALLSSNSARLARESVLLDHFSQAKRDAVAAWDHYQHALAEWEQHARDERAKASILVEHTVQLGPRPVAPHVPPVLPPHTLAEVMEKLVARTREIARLQLQQSTDSTEAMQQLHVPGTGRPLSGQHSGANAAAGGGGTNSSASGGKPTPVRHRKRESIMHNSTSHTLQVSGKPSPQSSRPTSGQNANGSAAGRKK